MVRGVVATAERFARGGVIAAVTAGRAVAAAAAFGLTRCHIAVTSSRESDESDPSSSEAAMTASRGRGFGLGWRGGVLRRKWESTGVEEQDLLAGGKAVMGVGERARLVEAREAGDGGAEDSADDSEEPTGWGDGDFGSGSGFVPRWKKPRISCDFPTILPHVAHRIMRVCR